MSFEEFWLGLNKAPIKVDCPPVSFMRHWTRQGVVPCRVICTKVSRVKIIVSGENWKREAWWGSEVLCKWGCKTEFQFQGFPLNIELDYWKQNFIVALCEIFFVNKVCWLRNFLCSGLDRFLDFKVTWGQF
jgi:hypothetical protein